MRHRVPRRSELFSATLDDVALLSSRTDKRRRATCGVKVFLTKTHNYLRSSPVGLDPTNLLQAPIQVTSGSASTIVRATHRHR